MLARLGENTTTLKSTDGEVSDVRTNIAELKPGHWQSLTDVATVVQDYAYHKSTSQP